MYYFIYNGEKYTFDPRNPLLEGFTDDGEPIIGSQTLQQSLGMTDEEAAAAHLEGLKNEFIRPKRDKLLAECDWVITMHKEKGTNIPAAWKTYRQALRDMTSQSDPQNAVWPEPPA